MTRPRAVNDFPAIRARMEELRRERAKLLAGDDLPPAARSRPYVVSARPILADRPGLSPAIRALIKVRNV